MACRLIGAKPLSEYSHYLANCQVDPFEEPLLNMYSKHNNFYAREWIWISRLQKGGHFVLAEMC